MRELLTDLLKKLRARLASPNRAERRAIVAGNLSRPERKLLQYAREKARGARERKSENDAAWELASARESVRLDLLAKKGRRTVRVAAIPEVIP